MLRVTVRCKALKPPFSCGLLEPVGRAHSFMCFKGAEAIQLGKASVTLCAGTENMSSAPLVVNGNDAR